MVSMPWPFQAINKRYRVNNNHVAYSLSNHVFIRQSKKFEVRHKVTIPRVVGVVNMQNVSGMRPRTIDAHNMHIIHRGSPWPHETPPCSKAMTQHLERNEAIVSWLQPIGGGVAEQLPCIQSGELLFPLSLRMQKAVWRHVRLKKDYVNIEPMSHGGFKLKIPHLLLREKVRTQARFNVS
jgi:hypothetical protein